MEKTNLNYQINFLMQVIFFIFSSIFFILLKIHTRVSGHCSYRHASLTVCDVDLTIPCPSTDQQRRPIYCVLHKDHVSYCTVMKG